MMLRTFTCMAWVDGSGLGASGVYLYLGVQTQSTRPLYCKLVWFGRKCRLEPYFVVVVIVF